MYVCHVVCKYACHVCISCVYVRVYDLYDVVCMNDLYVYDLYVCMHVRVYACMYVCMYVCMHV
jgi:hypothetical protein